MLFSHIVISTLLYNSINATITVFSPLLIIQLVTFSLFGLLTIISYNLNLLKNSLLPIFVLGGVSSAFAYFVLLPFQFFLLMIFKSDISNLFHNIINSNYSFTYFLYWFFLILLITVIRFIVVVRSSYFTFSTSNWLLFSLGWTISELLSLTFLIFFDIGYTELDFGVIEVLSTFILVYAWNVIITFFINECEKNTKFVLFTTIVDLFLVLFLIGFLADPTVSGLNDFFMNLSILLFSLLLLSIIQVFGRTEQIPSNEDDNIIN